MKNIRKDGKMMTQSHVTMIKVWQGSEISLNESRGKICLVE